MENLKVKVIRSTDEVYWEKKMNEFGSTNVQVIATQTHVQVAGGSEYSVVFVAVVYYKDKLPGLK